MTETPKKKAVPIVLAIIGGLLLLCSIAESCSRSTTPSKPAAPKPITAADSLRQERVACGRLLDDGRRVWRVNGYKTSEQWTSMGEGYATRGCHDTLGHAWETQAKAVRPSTWSVGNYVDDFGSRTGERFAHSKEASPVRTLDFPYGRATGALRIECGGRVLAIFSDAPSIDKPQWNSDTFRIKAQVDGRTVTWTVTHWEHADREYLRISGARGALLAGGTVALSVPMYREGNVLWRWDLGGSSAAVKRACNK